MNTWGRGAVCAVAVMCGATGCKKGAEGAGDGAAAAAVDPSASIFPAGSGLGAAGNDAAIVTIVKGMVSSCGTRWDDKKGWPSECMKPFNDLKVDKKDATFVALLEDPDAKVRALGTQGLDQNGDAYKTDKDLGTRTVAALEREPALPFNTELAYVVDQINLTNVPVGDRIKALGLNAKTPSDVRIAIITFWPQKTGPANTLGYDVVKAASASTEKKFKIAALDGYSEFDETKHDEACAFWAANLSNADPEIASAAWGHVTHASTGLSAHDDEGVWGVSGGDHAGNVRCTQLDQGIAFVEAKAKAGTVTESKMVYGLGMIARDKKSTPAQRKAALTALRAVLSNKANQDRSDAVGALVESDPSEKSFVKKFESDPSIGASVKTALAPKKK